MNVVSNTGPLIALAKADQLSLLAALYGSVSVPPAVLRELQAKTGDDVDRIRAALGQILQPVSLVALSEQVRDATAELGEGERQALAVAHSEKALVLIDDRLAREAARQLGVPVTGVVGILLAGKKAGHLRSVRSILQKMRAAGYWLSDDLIHEASKLAGET